MGRPRIAAAICTYCRRELLRGAVESLARQSLSPDQFEILVVDNSPDQDGSPGSAEAYSSISNLRWLSSPAPGLSAARNLATAACAAPLIAFLDDDAIASSGWLKELAASLEDCGKEMCAAGGRVDPLWLAPRPGWLPDELLGHLSVVNWGGVRRPVGAGEWLAGTNIAFRVADLQRIGGFSNKFGRSGGDEILLSNDENDVIGRLAQGEGKPFYVPEAIVQHLISAERLTQSWMRRRVVWQAVSDYLQRPHQMYVKAPRRWHDIARFNARLPLEYQTPHGLYLEQGDPEIFRRQMAALYSFTIVMLTGFAGFTGDP